MPINKIRNEPHNLKYEDDTQKTSDTTQTTSEEKQISEDFSPSKKPKIIFSPSLEEKNTKKKLKISKILI